MKYIAILSIIFISGLVHAQQGAMNVEHRTINKSWSIDPKSFKDDFQVSVRNLEAPYPGGEAERNSIKALKLKSDALYPRTATADRGGERTGNDSLKQLDNFPVRFFLNDATMNGGTPNDNTLAISNGGMLLTSYNTQLWGYDLEADTFLFSYNAKHPSFSQFMSVYNDTTFSLYFPFDPKLLYDPVRDRFVMVFLTGRDPSNSGAVVCFSSTNYPTDLWHGYWLSGNPFNDDTWTDYPQIAINDNSLYLTLNQLYPDSSWITGFAQTVIWQMDLDAGFSGASELPVKLWSGANYEGSKLRYLHPVKTAMGPESDTMYFVANRPFDIENDSVFLIRTVGDVANQSSVMDVKLAMTDLNYALPPDAIQPGGHTFLTNDARALGAVRMGREIQFVGNTKDLVSGKAAIYHGVIADVDNPSVEGRIITHEALDFGYPNIEHMGHKVADKDVVIFFNHSSADAPAGNSTVYCNSAREYGPVQVLCEGTTLVDRIPGTDERWGDYIGLQRKYNESSRAWAAGYISFANKSNGTWVSELAGPLDWPVGTQEVTKKSSLMAYPNPTADKTTVQFNMPSKSTASFELMDQSGRLVRTLARDMVKEGLNEVSFDLSPLAPGVYYLKISSEDAVLVNEKLVRQ